MHPRWAQEHHGVRFHTVTMSVARRGDLFPQVGWSRVPRRCRRALPTSPAWRCPAGRSRTTAACDPAGHRQDGMVPSGRRQRRGIRDEGDHKQRPPPVSANRPRPPLQSARRRHRLFTMGLTFQAPTRPPAASAAHCTPPNCATQRILLKPVRSRKNRLSNHRPNAPAHQPQPPARAHATAMTATVQGPRPTHTPRHPKNRAPSGTRLSNPPDV